MPIFRGVLTATVLTVVSLQESHADSIFVVDKRYEGEYSCRSAAGTALFPDDGGSGWRSQSVSPTIKEMIVSVQAAGLFRYEAPGGEAVPAMYYMVTLRSQAGDYSEQCKAYDEPRSREAPIGSLRFMGRVGKLEMRFFECWIGSGSFQISAQFDKYMRYGLRGYFDRGEYDGFPFIEVGTCTKIK